MANQVYNLTQTGAQVQSIINDANKVMGAGSQSTLTTDSILLKDTSGNYHKIDKSSFTEAVRNTMASLLVNNDKGTTISQVAAIASGDFGSITPDNLASVLGGDSLSLGLFSKRGEVPNNDFNNAIPYGIYYAMNTTDWTNGPVPKDQCIMLCYGWQVNARTIQVAFCVGAVSTNNAGVYIRIYKQGMEPLWSEWIKL